MIEKEYKYLLAKEEFYSIIKKLETFEYNEKKKLCKQIITMTLMIVFYINKIVHFVCVKKTASFLSN